MKQLILPSVLMLFGLCLIGGGIATNKVPQKEPVKVEYFINGQILLPDYACPDTLIVLDAETLNRNFAFVEQNISWGSDADIDSLLHCPNKQGLRACMTFDQYVEHLDGEGYRADIAQHIAFVDFKILKADSLYYSIIED